MNDWKVLAYRMMAKRRIIAVVFVITSVLLLLSADQISDKDRMQKLLCSLRGEDQAAIPDERVDGGRNVLQVNIDKINEEIMQLAADHTGPYEQRLPQAIVVGVRKCGTRALLEMLRLHPSIAAANPEIHFFDDEYENGLTWYREQMPYSYADQITMEKTPAYFITSEAPERIHRMNSSIKLLAIVRDPTTRSVSDYTQIKSHTSNQLRNFPSFEEKAIVNGKVNTEYQAIRTSIYANYVKKWYKYFPRSQLMFVDGVKLIENPFPEMKRVEHFLGLPPFFTKHNFVYNATKGFYCLRLKKLRCLGDKKGQSHPDVNPKVLRQLQDFFRPYNKKFFELIGTEFDWA